MSGRDRQTLRAGALDALDHLRHLRPVGRARSFQVVDLGANARAPRDVDQLVDGLEQAVALAAQVADVRAAEAPGLLAQRDELVRPGVEGRGVDQGRADAQRALLHRRTHERAHAHEFLSGRRTVVVVDDVHAHGGRADERGHVDRAAAAHDVVEVLPQRRPIDRE